MRELLNTKGSIDKTTPNWLLEYAVDSPAYELSVYNCQRFTQYTYMCVAAAPVAYCMPSSTAH